MNNLYATIEESNLNIETKVLCYEILNGIDARTFNPNATQKRVCDSLERTEREIDAVAWNYCFILAQQGKERNELAKALLAVKRIANIRYGWAIRKLIRKTPCTYQGEAHCVNNSASHVC